MAIKQRPDSPTNNFATWNPVHPSNNAFSGPTFTEGALRHAGNQSDGYSSFEIPTSGKWYCEILLVTSVAPQCGIGRKNANGGGNSTAFYGTYANPTKYVHYDGSITTTSNAGFNSTAGSITRLYIDADNNAFWMSKDNYWFTSDGTLTTTPTFGTGGLYNGANPLNFKDGYHIMVSNGNTSDVWHANFGQDPTFGGAKSPSTTYTDANGIGAFYYQPPTDALALCTANLQEMTPDVDDDVPKDYFKMAEWVGDGTTSRQITHNLGFDPDLVWIKNRDESRYGLIADSVRGKWDQTNGYRILVPSSTVRDDISEWSVNYRLIDKSSTTFSINGGVSTNESGKKFIAWCFRAGGAPTADNSNTSGAMTANSVSLNGTLQSNYTPAGLPTIYPKRMSINTNAGFSIVEWTANQQANATIPHGLNDVPRLIILKCTEVTGMHWAVYHPDTGGIDNGHLNAHIINGTDQASASSIYWSNTAPTSSVFTTGTDAVTGYTGKKFIGYIWSEVEDYSKFGSYTGNNSADGPFVYCGFRPAFVIIKRYNASGYNWMMYDSSRNTYNPVNEKLYANSVTSTITASDLDIDFLSNGFKVRGNSLGLNSTGSFIYMAFAEQPFNYANAR